MIKLRLVGCDRYNFRGELYQKGKVYAVGETKATLMLRQKDQFERFYFAKYREAPKKSVKQLAADAAAAAAVAAAQEAEAEGRVEEVIARPDGSEPDSPKIEVPEGPTAEEEEVDTDDDPELDEDDKGNPEEVVVDEDDPEDADEADTDRADGSEVEV